MLPCVHIDEFGVGGTLTLKSTDVFGADPPNPWEGKAETTQVQKWGLRNSWGSHLWPFPRPSLKAQAPLPLPSHRKQEFVLGEKEGMPPLYPGGEGCTELPRPPMAGRQKTGSCIPVQAVAPEGPACLPVLGALFPEAGGGWKKGLGWGRGCWWRQGGLGACSEGPLLCLFLGPGLGMDVTSTCTTYASP